MANDNTVKLSESFGEGKNGDVLTYSNTDGIVWQTLENTIPETTNHEGEVLGVSHKGEIEWVKREITTGIGLRKDGSGEVTLSLNTLDAHDGEVLTYHTHENQEGEQVQLILWKEGIPDTGTNEHRGHVLTVSDTDKVIWAAPQGGGGGGNPYTKVSVTPGISYANGKVSEYGWNLFDQDVNISNNTYSVLSTEIGYDSSKEYPDSLGIDVFKIKLPANTDFPMAVVEFQLKTGENASVNKVEVYVGETKLTQVKDAPYTEDLAYVHSYEDSQTHKIDYWIDAASIEDASSPPDKIINLYNSDIVKNRTSIVNNYYQDINVKVQVHIFGSCFRVMTSHQSEADAGS